MSKSFYCASLVVILAAGSAMFGQGPSQHSAKDEQTPIVAEVRSTISTGNASTDGAGQVHNGHYFRSRDGIVREDFVFGSVITNARAGTITILNHAKKEATVMSVNGADAGEIDAWRGRVEGARNRTRA